MKHYICTGGCGGVSSTPGVCKTDNCPLKGHPLKECDCTDNKHEKVMNMKKMDPVVHFEMPAKDKARVKKFYEEVFGWQMSQLGSDMGDYILAGTTPVDENMMAKEPGAINGGFFEYKDEDGFNAPHLVIQVEDLNASIEEVKKSGGQIIGEPMEIKGIGLYQSIKDSEGNNVGMLQTPQGK